MVCITRLFTVAAIASLGLFVAAPVNAGIVDAALGHPGDATQTSECCGGSAGRAFDGNTDGNFGDGSVTHSGNEAFNHSVTFDLLGTMAPTSIVVNNRTDCCGGRLRDITIQLLDANNHVISSSGVLNPGNSLGGGAGDFQNGPSTLTYTVPANSQARKVRVTRAASGGNGDDNANALSLAEVQVFANDVALGKPAFQSSEYCCGSFPATNVTDGNVHDFSHTNSNNVNPSLTVNLLHSFALTSIVLDNREDCCAFRLQDIKVEVLASDNSTVVFSVDHLNLNNVLNSPGAIGIDFHSLAEGIVVGQFIRITRNSLPGGGDDNNVLALAEVEAFAIPTPASLPMAMVVAGGLVLRRRR